MSFISGLFPALLLLAVLGIILALHWTIQFRLRHSKRRSPFPENFLRNPGETLRKQIDDTTDDIFTYAVYLLMLPPLSSRDTSPAPTSQEYPKPFQEPHSPS